MTFTFLDMVTIVALTITVCFLYCAHRIRRLP